MTGLGATPDTADFVASPDLLERAASWRDDDPDEVTRAELRLTLWPEGEERLLALAGFHGTPVEWRA